MARDIRYDPADRPRDEPKGDKDPWRNKIVSSKQEAHSQSTQEFDGSSPDTPE